MTILRICVCCHRRTPADPGGTSCGDCGDYICASCLDDDAPADVRCYWCAWARDTYAREHRLGVA